MNKFGKLALTVLAINVLIDCGLTDRVGAQTTPSSYCASLGNPSCEVLNIEPMGNATATNGQSNPIAVIKYCKNGAFGWTFAAVPIWYNQAFANQGATGLNVPGSAGGGGSTMMFLAWPGGGVNWMTYSACGNLP